ncbi:MAG: hypothetical protein CMM94_07535 [Rickettsiales bacterium]|nr:hypothetical protein [Rickettsiales bacterium]
MSSFDEREKAFENKYARDEELQFKVIARRNKLLGLWAAEQLGKDDADAEAYAKEVVVADFDEPGDDDVKRKVLADLQAAGIEISGEEVRAEMNRLLAVAKQQLMDAV